MGVFYCCVKGCTSNTGSALGNVSFFRFPKEQMRRLTWAKNCKRQDLENLSLNHVYKNYRVCSLHFENQMFSSLQKNRIKKDAVPTIFSWNKPTFEATSVLRTYENKLAKIMRATCEPDTVNNIIEHPQASTSHLTSTELPVASISLPTNLYFTLNLTEIPSSSCNVNLVSTFSSSTQPDAVTTRQSAKVSDMEKRRCRTCLEVVDTKCIEVTRRCYLEKSIKDAILILVPEMVSTLCDRDGVCKNCYRVLRSSLKFIKRCSEVELKIAEVNNPLKGLFLDLPSEQVSVSQENNISETFYVDLDHNYSCKSDVEIVPVSILQTILSKDGTSSLPLGGSSICDPLSAFEPNEDLNRDVKIATCDLPHTSTICSDLDTALNVCKAPEEVTMSCETCSEKFSPDDYQLHLEIHPPFVCNECGKGFKTKPSYVSHQKIHGEQYRILCDICGKFVKYGTGLEVHKVSHQKERPYMCHKCPRTYKSKHAYDRHENIVHRKLSRQQCHECGKIFQTMSLCRMHYRLKHLKLTPFVCNVCGRKFGRKDYLKNHLRRHTSEPRQARATSGKGRHGKIGTLGFKLRNPGKPVNCKVCGKQISSLHNLKLHLRTHTKMKSHKCKYCNLLFTMSANKKRHELTHTTNPEHKFRCNICWKWTQTEEELEIHLLVHRKRPPRHSCDTCGKKFYRSYLLNNHRMNEHVSPEDIRKAEEDIVIKNLLEYAEGCE